MDNYINFFSNESKPTVWQASGCFARASWRSKDEEDAGSSWKTSFGLAGMSSSFLANF